MSQTGKPHPHKGHFGINNFGINMGGSQYCSQETRQKISNSLKGKKFSSEHINNLKKARKGTRKKLTDIKEGSRTKPWHRRIQHWAIYQEWRLAVLKRDDFACISCGKVGAPLDVHHIIGTEENPDLAFEVNNGAALCKKCHKNIHMGNIKLLTA